MHICIYMNMYIYKHKWIYIHMCIYTHVFYTLLFFRYMYILDCYPTYIHIYCICMLHACVHAKLLRLCPTLCDPMDHSPAGFSVHGILQARILKWVAVSGTPFSRGSSQPRDQSHVSCGSCIAGRFFTAKPPGEAMYVTEIPKRTFWPAQPYIWIISMYNWN